MAFDYTGYLDFDVPANTDLSSKQYYFVTINSSGKAAVAGLGEDADGVLQNAPAAADRPAKIRPFGLSKVIAGGNITAGQNVTTDTNGKAVHTGSADGYVLGKALVTGVSGDVIPVLLKQQGLP